MKIVDILEETYFALSANKARSILTILGIVIGISSVIAMLSIGQGAQNSITSNIESIGSNLITVYPGSQKSGMVRSAMGSAKSLTLSDSDAIINEVSYVKAVSPEIFSRYQVTAKGTNTNSQIYGITSAYATVKNLEIASGDFITDSNNENSSKVAVIGPTVRDDLFGEDVADSDVIGQTIKINKISFQIIGITKSKGGSGFGSQDDMIFIPLSTSQRFLSKDEYLSSISVSAYDADSLTSVQEQITQLLLTRHNISDPNLADFRTLNQADIAETASSVAKTFTMLLGSVAGISLIVGGIGIMNMMLTNVTERTREIGLRKSIGAKRKDISNQFLIEAIALTIIGGLIGIVLGFGISWGLSYFGSITTKTTLLSILLAFGVSTAIGVIFGYYPASRAAKLNPIDALRYE
ncbi:MAG: ABC transporter permease [Patescibacteria group bacterium]|nr:ABC transporter permease [Patescibacteria group bacterium]MDD4304492.1 ABC transporter permease [Patescibacteria group bacterium]MDD4694852.1 ABC transporter permease [Patescibacteria group bacterium]